MPSTRNIQEVNVDPEITEMEGTKRYPYRWLEQAFGAKAVDKGNLIRRKITDVKKCASVADLVAYAKERGFHVIETGDQFVVFCNPGVLKIHC